MRYQEEFPKAEINGMWKTGVKLYGLQPNEYGEPSLLVSKRGYIQAKDRMINLRQLSTTMEVTADNRNEAQAFMPQAFAQTVADPIFSLVDGHRCNQRISFDALRGTPYELDFENAS